MKLTAVLAVVVAALLVSCQKKEQTEPAQTPEPAPAVAPAPEPEPAADAAVVPEETTPAEPTPAPAPEPANLNPTPQVTIDTNKGKIVLELDREKAPVTVENFLSYVNKSHYDGTVFHRVIDGFMIQGGGFALDGADAVEKPTGSGIKNEAKNGLKNDLGTVAMARTGDPDSATAQFFINVKNNDALNYPNPDGHGYAVFGKVIEGMDVVDSIKGVATGTKPLTMLHPATGQKLPPRPTPDVPTDPVVINSITVVE